MDNDIVIEPVTGKAYWVRGWRGNRHDVRMRGDTPNFQGMYLEGAYTYARLFGEWRLAVRRGWDAIRRAYTCVAARQDWRCPGPTAWTRASSSAATCLPTAGAVTTSWRRWRARWGRARTRRDAIYLGSRTLMTLGGTINRNERLTWRAPPTCLPASIRKRSPLAAATTAAYTVGAPTCPGGSRFTRSGCMVFDYPLYGSMLELLPRTLKQWVDDYTALVPEWSTPAYRDPSDPLSGSFAIVQVAGAFDIVKSRAGSVRTRRRCAGRCARSWRADGTPAGFTTGATRATSCRT